MHALNLLQTIVLGLAAGLLATPKSHAADWPQLGGPEGSGVSPETGLARTWSAAGPRVLWTVDVAPGFAGPAIYNGQVFLLDRKTNRQDSLRCLDLNTGRELWNLSYDAPGTLPYAGSRNVPTVDDRFIFTMGPFGHFHCIDRQTHQIVWVKHLVNDFKHPEIDRPEPAQTREEKLARTQLPKWGMTQAPLLFQDTVIVAPQTQKTGLVAYEKATGKIRWQSGYIGRNWYSHVSPHLVTLCGVEQVIMLAQPSDPEKSPSDAPPAIISSLDPLTGQLLWKTQTPMPHKIPIPQPLCVASNRLFITGGYSTGYLLLEATRNAGGWETKAVSHGRTVAGHIHSPVSYEDCIYLTSLKDQGGAQSGLVCLSRKGEPLWQTGPALQFDNGALLLADGMAFVIQGRTGLLHLFDVSGSSPVLLAKAGVLEARGAMVWAPMALSQGKLLVRDQHQLKCLDVKAP